MSATSGIFLEGNGLFRLVDGNLRAGVKINRYFMRSRVSRLRRPTHIRHGPRQHLHVLRQISGHERKGEPDACALEGINRPRGQDLKAGLRQRRKIWPAPRPSARKDFRQFSPGWSKRWGLPVQMGCVRAGQFVRRRPDAEIGITSHQRNRGGAMFRRWWRRQRKRPQEIRQAAESWRIFDSSKIKVEPCLRRLAIDVNNLSQLFSRTRRQVTTRNELESCGMKWPQHRPILHPAPLWPFYAT